MMKENTAKNISSCHPTRAVAVANWFLEKSWQDNSKPPCDQMKLYKLVYYAHGWFMGNFGQELFPEDVGAWPHGPVVSDLYVAFRSHGREPITKHGKRLEEKEGKFKFVIPEHDGTFSDFFETIWKVYGDLTGVQLSNMTHGPEEPWTIVAEKYNYNLSSKPTIPSEIIERVFAKKVNRLKKREDSAS